LIGELKLPEILHPKTKRRTFNKEAMEIYDELLSINDDNRAKDVLTYRGWQKSTSSSYKPYLQMLCPDCNRLHANYKLHGTKTARISCEKPNMQQIPKMSSKDWNGKLKSVIIAPPGYTAWEADYAQLEFRLAAAFAKEKALLDIFNDPSRDIFTEIAATLGMTRDKTKTLIYTLQYGGAAERISTVFGISKAAARVIIQNFFRNYPGIRHKTEQAAAICMDKGYIVYWTGRIRHFDDRKEQARKAFNSAMQGGAFEVVKHTMLRLNREGLHQDECYMDLQVHDSVRFCIKNGLEDEYLPRIKSVMEDVQPDFGVRFKVEIKKWATKEVWEPAG
jgi:DNA polymerase-1